MTGATYIKAMSVLGKDTNGAEDTVVDAVNRIRSFAKRKNLQIESSWLTQSSNDNGGRPVVYAKLSPFTDEPKVAIVVE
jgi:hypothetical protein